MCSRPRQTPFLLLHGETKWHNCSKNRSHSWAGNSEPEEASELQGRQESVPILLSCMHPNLGGHMCFFGFDPQKRKKKKNKLCCLNILISILGHLQVWFVISRYPLEFCLWIKSRAEGSPSCAWKQNSSLDLVGQLGQNHTGTKGQLRSECPCDVPHLWTTNPCLNPPQVFHKDAQGAGWRAGSSAQGLASHSVSCLPTQLSETKTWRILSQTSAPDTWQSSDAACSAGLRMGFQQPCREALSACFVCLVCLHCGAEETPLNSHIYYRFNMFKSIPPPFRWVLKPPCGWQFLEEDRSLPKAKLNLK